MIHLTEEEKNALKKLFGQKAPKPVKSKPNKKFQNWLFGVVCCLIAVFAYPIFCLFVGTSTRDIWLNALCAGEVVFTAITALITSINDSLDESQGKRSIAFDIFLLFSGSLVYAFIRVASELSAVSLDQASALPFSVVFFFLVMGRGTVIYVREWKRRN